MYLVAIAWMFVVVCMAAVEATTTSVVGALVTLFGYGVLPLALVLWLLGTPQRRRDRAGRAGPVRPRCRASQGLSCARISPPLWSAECTFTYRPPSW